MKPYYEDIELEKEILAAAFISDQAADRILTRCKPADFSRISHKKFYDAIHRLRKENKHIDLISMNHVTNEDDCYKFAEIHQRTRTDVMLDQHIDQLKPVTYKREIQLIKSPEDVIALYNRMEDDKKGHASTRIESSEIKRLTLEYFNRGGEPGISAGWIALDELYKISKAQLTILTGIPGSGKSEWLDAVCVNLALNQNWKVMYFSPENFPVSRHVRKLIEKYSGFPFFKGKPINLPSSELEKSIDWINQHFVFLNPALENRNLDYLINQVENIDAFVLDPWNEVEHSRPEGMTETEYIGQSLMKLKSLAIRQNIHVWIVTHPTKLQKTNEGVYPVPTPYDISGSANWRNKADNCISIFRNPNENRIQVHIQKIRFKDNGQPGMIELKYDPITGRFT